MKKKFHVAVAAVCLSVISSAHLNAMNMLIMEQPKTMSAQEVAMIKVNQTVQKAVYNIKMANFKEAYNCFLGKESDCEVVFTFDSYTKCCLDSGMFSKFDANHRWWARYYFAISAMGSGQRYLVCQILEPLQEDIQKKLACQLTTEELNIKAMWDKCLPEEAKLECDNALKEVKIALEESRCLWPQKGEALQASGKYGDIYNALLHISRFFKPKTNPRWFELIKVLPWAQQTSVFWTFLKIGSTYGKALLSDFIHHTKQYESDGICCFDSCYICLKPNEQRQLLRTAVENANFGEPIGWDRVCQNYGEMVEACKELNMYQDLGDIVDPRKKYN